MIIPFLFWSFAIASLLISILAISLKKTKLLFVSSVLILPLSLYLAATPRFGIWGLVFPFFYIGAAISLSRKLMWLSILLTVPNFLLIGWIADIIFQWTSVISSNG
jgi:hypothetical protein